MKYIYLFSLALGFSLAFSRGVAGAHQQEPLAVVPSETDVPDLPETAPTAYTSIQPTLSPTPYQPGSEDATLPSSNGIAVEELAMLFHDRGASRTIAHQPAYYVSLPDLQTLPPSDLRLVYDPSTGRKILRFTNSIWNSGTGQLELTGRPARTDDHIRVYQRIFAAKDSMVVGELKVGEFVFHDQHRHWHLEDFAQYEVRTLGIEGGLGGVMVAGSKISYCILDISRNSDIPAEREYSRSPDYMTCTADTQGLSPGWIDVYGHHLPRQWVEITNLPDGVYALVSTVNPDQVVLELDVDNNTGVTYFELNDMRIRVVEAPDRTHIPALLGRLTLILR